MLQNLQSALKIRVLAVLFIIHSGLALGIFALGRASSPGGLDETGALLVVSIGCLYGGFLLGVFLLLWGLLPWANRAQKAEHWTERLIRDLPVLIEHLPKAIAAAQTLMPKKSEAL